MRLIAQSMDCVEQQFESRDNNIASLEKRLEESGEVAVRLQSDLDAANEVIARLTVEAEKGMAQQKILLKQYQEAEMESRELQEFLQAEKMTLSETLKVREIITQGERRVVTFNDFNVVSHALLRAHRLARGLTRCPVVRRSPASVRANNGPDDIINRLLHLLVMDARYD